MVTVADTTSQNPALAMQQALNQQIGMNALAKMYGPTAFVPVQAGQNQAVAQNALMNPLLVQQQTGQNTALNQANAFNAAANPIKLADANVALNTAQSTYDTTQATKVRSALSTAADSLSTSLAAGEDPNAAFDKALATTQSLTGTPIPKAQADAYRAQWLSNPQGFIDQTREAVASAATSTLTPVDKANIAETAARGNYYNANAGAVTDKGQAALTTADARTIAANALAAKVVGTNPTTGKPVTVGDLNNQLAAAQATKVQSNIAVSKGGPLDQLSALVDELPAALPLAQIKNPLTGQPMNPGVSAFESAAKTIQAQLSLRDLQNMVASGVHFGKVTNTELLAAANAYGNLDPTTTPKDQLKQNIATIRQFWNDINGPIDTNIAGLQSRISAASQSATPAPQTGGSLSWRNNNPGNIRMGSFAEAHGATGESGGFATFPDYATGRAATEALLASPSYSGLTLKDAIGKWAPPSENDTGAYVADVSKLTGVDPNTKLSDMTPQQRAALADAIQQHEGWVPGDGSAPPTQGAPAPAAPPAPDVNAALNNQALTQVAPAPQPGTRGQNAAVQDQQPQQAAPQPAAPQQAAPLTPAQIQDPTFQIPGYGAPVSQFILDARAAMQRGDWTMQQVQQAALMYGVPPQLITGMHQ